MGLYEITTAETDNVRLTRIVGPSDVHQSLGAGGSQTISTSQEYRATKLTSDNDTTDETGTLGSGEYTGQIKTIVMAVDGGDDWIVTITNHETSDPEVATFDAVDEYLTLVWTGTEWATIANTCTF